jgi:hypothetical protein
MYRDYVFFFRRTKKRKTLCIQRFCLDNCEFHVNITNYEFYARLKIFFDFLQKKHYHNIRHIRQIHQTRHICYIVVIRRTLLFLCFDSFDSSLCRTIFDHVQSSQNYVMLSDNAQSLFVCHLIRVRDRFTNVEKYASNERNAISLRFEREERKSHSTTLKRKKEKSHSTTLRKKEKRSHSTTLSSFIRRHHE